MSKRFERKIKQDHTKEDKISPRQGLENSSTNGQAQGLLFSPTSKQQSSYTNVKDLKAI